MEISFEQLSIFRLTSNEIIVCWVKSKNEVQETVVEWLQEFRQCFLTSYPTWKPSAFVVDDALTKIWVIGCEDILIYLSFIVYLFNHYVFS